MNLESITVSFNQVHYYFLFTVLDTKVNLGKILFFSSLIFFSETWRGREAITPGRTLCCELLYVKDFYSVWPAPLKVHFSRAWPYPGGTFADAGTFQTPLISFFRNSGHRWPLFSSPSRSWPLVAPQNRPKPPSIAPKKNENSCYVT